MTIEQLGSLGEFLAAIATLITLIYLALQIRRNTAVARATGTSEHTAILNNFNFALAQDPELYALYFRGLVEPEAIAEEDRMKFDLLVGTYLETLLQTFYLDSEGALAEGIWDNHFQSLKWLVKQPGFAEHWHRWVRNENMEFNKLVTDLMSET